MTFKSAYFCFFAARQKIQQRAFIEDKQTAEVGAICQFPAEEKCLPSLGVKESPETRRRTLFLEIRNIDIQTAMGNRENLVQAGNRTRETALRCWIALLFFVV